MGPAATLRPNFFSPHYSNHPTRPAAHAPLTLFPSLCYPLGAQPRAR